ncbi:hypothetical protein FHG89_00810, partial [Micromonospora orduensis]
LTGDRDDVAAELQGERFRHDRHPSSEEQILTGQESTEPGAVPAGSSTTWSRRRPRRRASTACPPSRPPLPVRVPRRLRPRQPRAGVRGPLGADVSVSVMTHRYIHDSQS